MLTGDKLETAISIGLSTKLLTPEMHYVIVKETDSDKIREEMQSHIEYGGRVMPTALGGSPPCARVLTTGHAISADLRASATCSARSPRSCP